MTSSVGPMKAMKAGLKSMKAKALPRNGIRVCFNTHSKGFKTVFLDAEASDTILKLKRRLLVKEPGAGDADFLRRIGDRCLMLEWDRTLFDYDILPGPIGPIVWYQDADEEFLGGRITYEDDDEEM
jgi:hypothetical protein